MEEARDVAELIAKACEAALTEGAKDWKDIRASILIQLKALPEARQTELRYQLSLMLSREADQSHKIVAQ
jgi:hypothetical protein